MVAVLAFTQSRGAWLREAMTSFSKRVLRIRDSWIERRFAAVYLQLTLRPARLIQTSLSSRSATQPPGVRPSQETMRHGADRGSRLNTVTVCPFAWKWRAR